MQVQMELAAVDQSEGGAAVRLQNKIRQVVFAAATAPLLWILGIHYWPYMVAGIAAVNLFPSWRRPLLISFTLVGWFVYGFPWIQIAELASRHEWLGALPVMILKTFILVGAGSLAFMFLFVQRRWRLMAEWPVAFLMIFSLVFFFSSAALTDFGGLFVFSWLVCLVFTKFIWYLAFASSELNDRSVKSCLLQTGQTYPFWSILVLPMPDTALFTERLAETGAKERIAIQISGLRLFVVLVALMMTRAALLYFLHGQETTLTAGWTLPNLGLPPILSEGVDRANGLHLPVYRIWLLCLGDTAVFFLSMAITMGTVVATARMVGLFGPNQVNCPWRAKNFNDFLSRMVHYYSRIVMKFFVVPGMRRLSFIANRKIRLFVAIFLAIQLAGPFIHFFAYSRKLVTGGTAESLWALAAALPYFSMVGFLSAAAAVLERSRQRAGLAGLPQPIRLPLYFAAFSVAVTISGIFMLDWNPDGAWVFFKSLFGIRGAG
jgi:hypothetical protein